MLKCLGFPFINKNTRSENSPTKKKILKHDKNKDRPYKFLNSNKYTKQDKWFQFIYPKNHKILSK